MAHIPLPRYLVEPRFRTGRSPKMPVRNQLVHGRRLEQQLRTLFDTVGERRDARAPELPPLPAAVQLLVESSAAKGKPILTQASLPKGWNLEGVEERPDGILTAISGDPTLAKRRRSVVAFRQNERTAKGRLRFGSTKIAALQGIVAADRTLKLGEELLLQGPIRRGQAYLVDIEVAAGYSLDDHAQRREEFGAYLRAADAVIIGTGAIVEEDYALFRARIAGRVLLDLVDNH